MKDEDIGSIRRTGEPADVGVIHFTQVTMQLVKDNGLVKVAWGKVGGARSSEGNSKWLGERVELHGKQGGGVVAVGSEWDLQCGYGHGIAMTRIHNCKRTIPVWAAHLGRVTPGCSRAKRTVSAVHELHKANT